MVKQRIPNVSQGIGEKLWFTALWVQFFYIACITMPWNHGLAHLFIECTMLASIMLCCVKIFFVDRESAKALCLAAAVLAVSTVSALAAHQRHFLGLIALVMGCRDISFRRIIRHYFRFCLIYIALTLFLFSLGCLPSNTSGIRYAGSILKSWQFDLGFIHYNYAAMWFFLAALCTALTVPRQFAARTNLLCIALMLGIFCITSSRTVLIISILTFPVLLVQQFYPGFLERISKIRVLSAVGILALIATVFVLTYLYSPDRPFIKLVNRLLSGRLNLGHYCLNLQTLGYLGHPGEPPVFLDFLYLYICYRFGIPALVLYVGLQLYAADRLIRFRQWDFWIAAVIMVVYSLSEYSMRSCIMMMLYPAFARLDE